MILALAMGHTVERPAIRMGGGKKTYEAALPAAVCSALDNYRCFLIHIRRGEENVE